MTTARPGGRPWRRGERATSSATAARISSAIGPPSSTARGRAVGHGQPRCRGGSGFGGLAAARRPRGSASRGPRSSARSSVTRGRHLAFDLRVADRRQVDEDVGRRAPGGGLGEQGRHVEVARGVGVAAAGERLGDADELQARLDAGERDLGGVRAAARMAVLRAAISASVVLGQLQRRREPGVGRGVLVGERQEPVRQLVAASRSPRRAAPRARRTWADRSTARRPSGRGWRRAPPRRPRRCRPRDRLGRSETLDEASRVRSPKRPVYPWVHARL